MSEEILINGKKITELSDMFFEYCELKKENEKLKEENEQLKKPCLVMPKVNQLAVPIYKYEKLYRALEEIREIIEMPKYTCKEFLYIRGKINEVLNDRN